MDNSSPQSHIFADYGLVIEITKTSPIIPADGLAIFDWYWSLPTCEITIERPSGLKNENHECSGRGTCDRNTGLCKCYTGYDGGNCGY